MDADVARQSVHGLHHSTMAQLIIIIIMIIIIITLSSS